MPGKALLNDNENSDDLAVGEFVVVTGTSWLYITLKKNFTCNCLVYLKMISEGLN